MSAPGSRLEMIICADAACAPGLSPLRHQCASILALALCLCNLRGVASKPFSTKVDATTENRFAPKHADSMASKFARVRRVGCALAAACIANALAPAKQPDAVRRGVFNGAAAALAAAAPAAWAVDASAAIAVERSGFAPTIKQTGRTSRYEDTILGPRGSKSTVQITSRPQPSLSSHHSRFSRVVRVR